MGSNTGAGQPHRSDEEAARRAAVPAVAAASALRWRQVFHGEERQLGVLRRWLASLLPECPARDDVISVATELGSNALRHTASGRRGLFAVEVTWHESIVRVTVADGGSPAEPHVIEDPAAEHGRGLLLVRGLSVRTGGAGDHRGRLVWADIAWDGPNALGRAPSQDPYETAIRDGHAALAQCFADVPAWFGRSTLAWWALAGPDELVTAPSARELAELLHRLLDAPAPPEADAAECARRDAAKQDQPICIPRHRPDSGSNPRLGSGTGHPVDRDGRGGARGRVGGNPGRARVSPGWPGAMLAPVV
jgi:Histidine kinase-like ATPase domain